MDFFLKWLLMASVQLAATMSPGPAFVVAVRNSLAYERKVGVFTALGLALGVGAHVVFVLAGIAIIIAKSVYLYTAIKYLGAAYLVYIGVKSILSKKRDTENEAQSDVKAVSMTALQAIKVGFLTNLLNPKAVVFFTAVFTQFIDTHTSFVVLVLYGLTSVVIEFLWFAGVTIVLTNPIIQKKFIGIVHWIERSCGGIMIALGLKLALSK